MVTIKLQLYPLIYIASRSWATKLLRWHQTCRFSPFSSHLSKKLCSSLNNSNKILFEIQIRGSRQSSLFKEIRHPQTKCYYRPSLIHIKRAETDNRLQCLMPNNMKLHGTSAIVQRSCWYWGYHFTQFTWYKHEEHL